MNGQSQKLLIVDDEEINIQLLASILADNKLTLVANNGSDALAMARKERPILAIRVRGRVEGDWRAFIEEWEARYDNLAGLFETGAAARVGDTDVILAGDDLADYVSQMATRLEVTRCLAEETNAATGRAN